MKIKPRAARTALGGAAALLLFLLSGSFFETGCAFFEATPDTPISRLRERIRQEFPVEPVRAAVLQDDPRSSREIELGEALFFDPNLSSCGSVACATCHLPEKGFSDGRRVSRGCKEALGRRNSNTIYNTAYLDHLFWDGRAQSLEEQALAPVIDPVEMANSWEEVIVYLKTGRHPGTGNEFPGSARYYRDAFEALFRGSITAENVARAIAAYERSVVTRDAPFDRWLAGDDSALTAAQKKGALIFFGRAKCSQCHQPPNFTDSEFHNVAVPRKGFETAQMFPDNENICGGVKEAADPGRAGVEPLNAPCSGVGRFKTPTLRNIELTSPYMHNGIFSGLEDVLRHYWNVGRGTADPVFGEIDEKAQFIQLTSFGGQPEDFINLTEFLKSLTGTQVAGPERGIAPPE